MNFQKLACFLGFHQWRYTPTQYRTPLDERLAIPLKEGERVCEHCQKRQIEDIHCLGLNPPEYHTSWHNAAPATSYSDTEAQPS